MYDDITAEVSAIRSLLVAALAEQAAATKSDSRIDTIAAIARTFVTTGAMADANTFDPHGMRSRRAIDRIAAESRTLAKSDKMDQPSTVELETHQQISTSAK